MNPHTASKAAPFDRKSFEAFLKRRFFFTESYEFYRKGSGFTGDNRGLYDYGPPGCALQANIVDIWRKHFVLEEDMLELDCSVVTPEEVFKTSGHVERFEDWMCKDEATGEYLRADHLLQSALRARLEKGTAHNETKAQYEKVLAKIDSYNGIELGEMIDKFDVRSPNGNGKVGVPLPFNLMFKSSIGPSAVAPIYLRPETAQGQFLNFRKCLEYNNNSMPFASASIGKCYRNEISPRTGLLRVREFLLAEVEHYVDPQGGKRHSRFDEVSKDVLSLLDRGTQLDGKTESKDIPVGFAVGARIVDNQTLGYFLARIQSFLLKLGIDRKRLRFRQHLLNEMAHYASDCWDAELLTSHGWIECVGCADRSAYDLTVHAKRTGEALVVKEQLETPIEMEEWVADLDRRMLGPKFRKNAKAVEGAIRASSDEDLARMANELQQYGSCSLQITEPDDSPVKYNLDKEIISIKRIRRSQYFREYTPSVIEPSFGIGRVLYSLLEHVYWQRPGNEARGVSMHKGKSLLASKFGSSIQVLALPILAAPTKVLIVPLSTNAALNVVARRIALSLRLLGISNRTDCSNASIGKRYARNDELGLPLGITVDFVTVQDGSITLRERDSMSQVRGSEDEIITAVGNLVTERETWEEVCGRLAAFTG